MSNSFRDFNQALISDLRANQGRASGGPFRGADVLILTTTGAKTGKPRENPLAFSSENGDYVVVASKGGAPTNPAWYHNLVANPVVTVEALGETFKARARVIDGEQEVRPRVPGPFSGSFPDRVQGAFGLLTPSGFEQVCRVRELGVVVRRDTGRGNVRLQGRSRKNQDPGESQAPGRANG